MSAEDRVEELDLVRGKLKDIMLPAPEHKVVHLKEKLLDLNTDVSKVCVKYLDSCPQIRMIDLMTICHILNREELFIVEDEESVAEDDFLRALETSLEITSRDP